ncbi:ubiquinone biosynthesis monooxygenase COQ6, mitochondrial [Ischnura elegans]|uniref:ubiquinone biosynthesis monooxygenase COQ6, mitochondrial n=1 Tax=Ischnura elegans TaxID=197161 RepID=UPI001ED883BA|nr:ubiquinone biosynthesis monooxygenase COQ6, mitochondrial [Ischnura elegans]
MEIMTSACCRKIVSVSLSKRFLGVSVAVVKRGISDDNAQSKNYDIIIAGGGMVGTAMACSLGRNRKFSNHKILLLEESPEKTWDLKPEYSNRVSALGAHSKMFLDSIGAWSHIEKARLKEVKKMQVWDAFSEAVITFNDENLQDDIAYVVENDVVMSAINKQLKETNGPVETIYKAKIKSFKLPSKSEYAKSGSVKVQLEDGTDFSCNLLIGADGANSRVRNAMGVNYLSWSYGQMGVVATLKLSEPTNNIVAWQRFLPTGPIALLPLNDELSSLVWSTSTEDAKLLLDLDSESFVDYINEALWKQYPIEKPVEAITKNLSSLLYNIFGPTAAAGARQLPPSVKCIVEGSKAAFPLGFGHSTKYIGPGVALIGDSAHRVHPLAGMGVNLGFGDVNCLQKKLSEAVHSGSEIGNPEYLLEYETERQRHNFPRMVFIDALHKLYGTSFMPVVLLRSVGLQLTDALKPLKKVIMKRAGA